MTPSSRESERDPAPLEEGVESWWDTHRDWTGIGAAIARGDREGFEEHADSLRDALDAMAARIDDHHNAGEESGGDGR